MKLRVFVAGLLLLVLGPFLAVGWQRVKSIQLYSKSRMPKFNDDDEAELQRITSGVSNEVKDNEYDEWLDEMTNSAPNFEDNKPNRLKSKPANKVVDKPANKVVEKPNNDWRSAMNRSPQQSNIVIPTRTDSSTNDISMYELDYDDFESAMDEEDGDGFGSEGSNKSWKGMTIPEISGGLRTGDLVPTTAWPHLVDSENNGFKYVKLHKENCEIAIVYADPRRMTDEFKEMIDQFNRLPLTTLPLTTCVCAVNCDDNNDHRKFIKKNNNNIKFPLLSDPTKKFMDLMKCRGSQRLVHALFIMDVKSNNIIKIWYENEWDTVTSKDILVDAIKKYAANKQEYIRYQLNPSGL